MNTFVQIQTENVDWYFVENGSCRAESVPLLLVHGFPLDHSMWRYQIESLSKHTRVICPDLTGFGKSRPTRWITDYLMGLYAIHLAEFLDALEIERVDFCGLSMGGYIGWQFWRNHHAQIRKLIACDTRAIADPPEVARGRRMMAKTIERDGAESIIAGGMIEKLFASTSLVQNQDIIEQTNLVIAATDPSAIAAAQLGMSVRPDVTPWLANIDVETLVVVGSEDVISPVDEMKDIAGAIPGAKFVEIPNAGHMAPLERPEAFNAAVVDFLCC